MKKRFRFILLSFLALCVGLMAGYSCTSTNPTQRALKNKKLLNGTITLKSDNSTDGGRLSYHDVPFSVTNNMANPYVQGTVYFNFNGFSTHPTILVLDDAEFNSWVSRNETVPIYDSWNVSITVKLPMPGAYHLVFYNQAELIPGNPEGSGPLYASSPVKITANVNLYWSQ